MIFSRNWVFKKENNLNLINRLIIKTVKLKRKYYNCFQNNLKCEDYFLCITKK